MKVQEMSKWSNQMPLLFDLFFSYILAQLDVEGPQCIY